MVSLSLLYVAIVSLLTFIKRHKSVVLDPFRFVFVNFFSCCTFKLHRLQCFGEGFNVFGHTENEFMIPYIDCTTEEFARFRVSPRNDEILAAHEIPLKPSGNQAIDMFPNGYKNFAREVAALLSTMQLIFEMHSCRAVLGK